MPRVFSGTTEPIIVLKILAKSMRLNKEQANELWSCIVESCKATEDDRDAFIWCMTEEKPSNEFRFGGLLGSGGKLFIGKPPYVSCYQEDSNIFRENIIEQTNQELKKIYDRWPNI